MVLTAERFTQGAYLRTAGVREDSQIVESDDLAYVHTPSHPERWMNSVARVIQGPERFSEVDLLTERFAKTLCNFNWHLWPSSHPSLERYLTEKVGLVTLGKCDFLTKSAEGGVKKSLEALSGQSLSEYLDAKLLGWGNDVKWRAEMESAARALLKDPRNRTDLLRTADGVVGAVSSYSDRGFAYLRGDFVVPAFRGRGWYREMILAREYQLAQSGVKTLCVIADQNTSSPIYQKLGYTKQNEIVILAKKASAWVSL